MANKRQYKTLTTKQSTKVKRYTKEGKTQGQIARLLGVSKQRVSDAQRKVGIGKRGAFAKDVKAYRELTDATYKESVKAMFHSPKWGKKRAARKGKQWKSYQDRQAEMKRLREEFEGEELERELNQELEDYMYGDTPK